MEEEKKERKDGERRKYPRKDVITKLSYRVVTPPGGEGLTYNISEGGLCIVLDKEIPIGSILELRFELPGEKSGPIDTYARVIWQKKTEKGFLTGVKFGT